MGVAFFFSLFKKMFLIFFFLFFLSKFPEKIEKGGRGGGVDRHAVRFAQLESKSYLPFYFSMVLLFFSICVRHSQKNVNSNCSGSQIFYRGFLNGIVNEIIFSMNICLCQTLACPNVPCS